MVNRAIQKINITPSAAVAKFSYRGGKKRRLSNRSRLETNVRGKKKNSIAHTAQLSWSIKTLQA